jgi:hypothetical protein
MRQYLLTLRTFFFGRFEKDLVMSVAGIHATVISILIGLSVAYALHINAQINEVETDALKIAEGVNDIRFSAWFRFYRQQIP